MNPGAAKSSLEIGALQSGVTLSIDDERWRAAYEAPAGSFVSVTLSGRDESWGVFVTRDEALALHAWLGRLLAERTRRIAPPVP